MTYCNNKITSKIYWRFGRYVVCAIKKAGGKAGGSDHSINGELFDFPE
jgi:hypothetical protein